LTLTIAKLLICTVSDRTLAFPSESIEEIVIPKPGQRQQLGKQRFLHWREQPVPIYGVTDLLDYSCPLPETPLSPALQAVPSPDDWELPMLLLKQGQQFCALEIERLLTEQELVIKPFGAAIAPPSYTYGCTILGDGSLIPVIDGVELLNHFLGEGTGDWQKTRESQHRLSERVNATGLAVASKELEEPSSLDNPRGSQDSSPSSPHRLMPAPASSASNWTTNQTSSTLPRILVVDDAVTLRRTLALSLEKVGFRVLQAGDGREAIQQLQEHPSTQLVICDVEMPNMNGFDFLNYRRQDAQLAQIPVIMLTSRSNHKHQWLAMHLGATAYFTKPYIEQTFLKAIKDVLNDAG
ncbi:MAG TPA: response regulator, partial [Stenomitos sp.]